MNQMFNDLQIEQESERAAMWAEYDSAAEWCAKRGLKGIPGDPLPDKMSGACVAEICDHPEAFAERVNGFAYALAMSKHELKD